MKTYYASYQTKETEISNAVFEAKNLSEAKSKAQFHKRMTPEINQVKNVRTFVHLEN